MARMYEMNLMIRLQDRASARMRRIAGDMNAMSRHAQAQNKLQNLRNQGLKTELSIQKKMDAATELSNRKSEVGQRNVSRRAAAEARYYRAQQTAINATTAAERRRWALLDAQGRAVSSLSAKQKSALLGLESAQANMNAETMKQVAARRIIQAEIAEEIRLLNKVNAEIAARAPLEAAGMAAAKRHQQGKALTHGGSLAFMGGAVAVGASALAAGSFAKFNVQVAKAGTQVTNTNLDITQSILQTRRVTSDLQTRLLGMAKQFPATAEEMASSLYNVFSSMDLGNTAAERMTNGIKVLNEANKAAVGGQVDLATATDTLITVFNDFDPNLKNIHENMAELFSIVRFMRGGFEELSAGMNKLAPAARTAKQSLVEVGAAFAVVTQAIPSAAQSSTAVARLMDLFGSKDFIAGMKKAGEGITDMHGDLLPLSQILDHIVALDPGLQKGGPKLAQLVKELTQFGSATGKGGSKGLIQMQRALSVLITEHAKHLRILKQAKQDTVEYDKSVQILSETADVKWKTAMNNLRVAWIQFGQAAMPVLLDLLKAFSGALNAFNGLSGGTRKWIGILIVGIGILTTFGGLMASAFGGVMMIVATRRLWNVEKALKAIAIANGEVAATSGGATGGIVGMGKAALKTAGWLGLIVLAFESLKGGLDEFQGQEVHGNKFQQVFRGWATQFKTGSHFLAQFVGQGDEVNQLYEDIFNAAPILFGKATKKQKKIKDDLTKSEKQNDVDVIKSGKSKLDAIIAANAAANESDKKLATWKKKRDKAEVSARQQALKQQKDDIDSAVKNLMSKYQELKAANEAAIGGILNGPISGGPVLSAFADINKTLMGIGIKPIKVPVQFLMQDAQAQLANFDLWRESLAKIAKRVPPEMLQELRAAGIEKLPEILSLADAGPGFLKEYVGIWKKTKTARDTATKADMDSTLKLWNSYGKDVAWQIVNGLIDSGAEAKIYEGFTKMITTTFAGQLKATMDKAVAEAVADWIEGNPKPTTKPHPSKTDMEKAQDDYDKSKAAAAAAQRPGYSASDRANANAFAKGNTMGPPAPPKTAGRKYITPQEVPPGTKLQKMRGKVWYWTGSRWIEVRKPKPDEVGSGNFNFATGGAVPGSGTGDTVPAMLTPGEVVLNKRHITNVSAMLGTANNPHALFSKIQHFAKGGVAAAENYKHMKGVHFSQDTKSGDIRVVNGAGVTYRTFHRGQPGYDELRNRAIGDTFKGSGQSSGLIGAGKDLLKGFTPHGLKEQGKGIYGSFRHPIRRVQSGGLMTYPGGKPGKDLFSDPGAATSRAAIDARKAALKAKKASLGVKSPYQNILDYIGVKTISPEELAALDERMARDAHYTGPANQMPDKARVAASKAATEHTRLAKRKAQAALTKTTGVEKHNENISKSIQTVLASGNKLLDEYNKFVPNWESTIRNYPETAADFAGSFLYHAKAANKRISAAEASALKNKGLRDRLEGAPEPGASKRKPAAPIPGTAGMLKSLRDAKKAKKAAGNATKKGTKPKPSSKQIGEAKTVQRMVGPISAETVAAMRDKTKAALKRVASEETGSLDIGKLFHLDRNLPSSLRGNIIEAFDAINTVHSIPDLMERYPLEKLPKGHEARGRILNEVDPRGNFIRMVKMQIGASEESAPWYNYKPGQEQANTLHEVGHALDVNVFGKARGFGSESGETADVMRAIHGSGTNQILRNKATRDGWPAEELNKFYPLMPRELFARAYAQWIAKRQTTKNWRMSAHLEDEKFSPRWKWPMQWEADEFNPIAGEFDKLFRSKGLLKYGGGGWVPGTGDGDKMPAFLTPGEFILSKPMIKGLTNKSNNGGSHVTHETNLNIDVKDPTARAILNALKPTLFSLRNQP